MAMANILTLSFDNVKDVNPQLLYDICLRVLNGPCADVFRRLLSYNVHERNILQRMTEKKSEFQSEKDFNKIWEKLSSGDGYESLDITNLYSLLRNCTDLRLLKQAEIFPYVDDIREIRNDVTHNWPTSISSRKFLEYSSRLQKSIRAIESYLKTSHHKHVVEEIFRKNTELLLKIEIEFPLQTKNKKKQTKKRQRNKVNTKTDPQKCGTCDETAELKTKSKFKDNDSDSSDDDDIEDIDKILNRVSAIRNTKSGSIEIHNKNYDETQESNFSDSLMSCLEGGRLQGMDEILEKCTGEEYSVSNTEEGRLITLRFEKSKYLCTNTINSKVAFQSNIKDANKHQMIKIILDDQDYPINIPSCPSLSETLEKGRTLFLPESAHLQYKGVNIKEENDNTLQKYVENVKQCIRHNLHLYLTAFTKNEKGGSLVIGVNDKTNERSGKTTWTVKGFPLNLSTEACTKNNQCDECSLKRYTRHIIVSKTLWMQRQADGTFEDCSSDLDFIKRHFELRFYPVKVASRDPYYILEIAVSHFKGIVFHDKKGPHCYTVSHDGKTMKRMPVKEWISRIVEENQTKKHKKSKHWRTFLNEFPPLLTIALEFTKQTNKEVMLQPCTQVLTTIRKTVKESQLQMGKICKCTNWLKHQLQDMEKGNLCTDEHRNEFERTILQMKESDDEILRAMKSLSEELDAIYEKTIEASVKHRQEIDQTMKRKHLLEEELKMRLEKEQEIRRWIDEVLEKAHKNKPSNSSDEGTANDQNMLHILDLFQKRYIDPFEERITLVKEKLSNDAEEQKLRIRASSSSPFLQELSKLIFHWDQCIELPYNVLNHIDIVHVPKLSSTSVKSILHLIGEELETIQIFCEIYNKIAKEIVHKLHLIEYSIHGQRDNNLQFASFETEIANLISQNLRDVNR